MLIMLIIWELADPPHHSGGGSPKSPRIINMTNMIKISPVLASFWKNKKKADWHG